VRWLIPGSQQACARLVTVTGRTLPIVNFFSSSGNTKLILSIDYTTKKTHPTSHFLKLAAYPGFFKVEPRKSPSFFKKTCLE
jgi:hypothetical protein